jgi:hypothetical protein
MLMTLNFSSSGSLPRNLKALGVQAHCNSEFGKELVYWLVVSDFIDDKVQKMLMERNHRYVEFES